MIYILYFSKPVGTEKHRAQFYVGYCSDREGALERRIAEHRSGQGAHITRAAIRTGAELKVVLTLPGFRDEERQIKAWKDTKGFLRARGVDTSNLDNLRSIC